MGFDDWETAHPDLCDELIRAWKEKEKREEYRLAASMLVTASANGGKKRGGGSLSLDDFLPEWVKKEAKKEKDPQKSEDALKTALFGMALKSGTVKNNG